MQNIIISEQKANNTLRAENEDLKRDLEAMRDLQESAKQVNKHYQDERQMRLNAEADISRLREQMADVLSTSKQETDCLKRAIEDMKLKYEEAVRNVNVKNEEIESMMDQMDNLSKIIENKEN